MNITSQDPPSAIPSRRGKIFVLGSMGTSRPSKNRVERRRNETPQIAVGTFMKYPGEEIVEKVANEKRRVILLFGEAQGGSGVSPATDAQRSRQKNGRSRNGRFLPAYGEAAASPAENPMDFSFRSFSTVS